MQVWWPQWHSCDKRCCSDPQIDILTLLRLFIAVHCGCCCCCCNADMVIPFVGAVGLWVITDEVILVPFPEATIAKAACFTASAFGLHGSVFVDPLLLFGRELVVSADCCGCGSCCCCCGCPCWTAWLSDVTPSSTAAVWAASINNDGRLDGRGRWGWVIHWKD